MDTMLNCYMVHFIYYYFFVFCIVLSTCAVYVMKKSSISSFYKYLISISEDAVTSWMKHTRETSSMTRFCHFACIRKPNLTCGYSNNKHFKDDVLPLSICREFSNETIIGHLIARKNKTHFYKSQHYTPGIIVTDWLIDWLIDWLLYATSAQKDY